jgi:hypothetical protein
MKAVMRGGYTVHPRGHQAVPVDAAHAVTYDSLKKAYTPHVSLIIPVID